MPSHRPQARTLVLHEPPPPAEAVTPTHVLGGGARDLNPRLGEEGAGAQHEHDVHHGVDGVFQDRAERLGWGQVIAEATHRVGPRWPAGGGVLGGFQRAVSAAPPLPSADAALSRRPQRSCPPRNVTESATGTAGKRLGGNQTLAVSKARGASPAQPQPSHPSVRPVTRSWSRCTYRPGAQQADQQVAAEAGGQHLGDDVQVGHQSGLQDDGDVGRVEELDGVGVVLAPVPGRLDGQVDAEALRSRAEARFSLPRSSLAQGSDPGSQRPPQPATALGGKGTEGSRKAA